MTPPPLWTMRPSPVTNVTPSRWSLMGPKPCRSGPAVAVETTEPSVRPARPGGSIASHGEPRAAVGELLAQLIEPDSGLRGCRQVRRLDRWYPIETSGGERQVGR